MPRGVHPSIVANDIRAGLAHLDWLTNEIEFHRERGAVAEVAALIEEATALARDIYALLLRETETEPRK